MPSLSPEPEEEDVPDLVKKETPEPSFPPEEAEADADEAVFSLYFSESTPCQPRTSKATVL